jgi:hypothetical protein
LSRSKSIEQETARGLEPSRELLVKQHTQLLNCLRSQFAEFGIVATAGRLRRTDRAHRRR